MKIEQQIETLQRAIFELANDQKELKKEFLNHICMGDYCPHTGR